MTAHSRISASAEIVGSIDDLLTNILVCLPVKSLVRFMSVSKGWKSLITSTCFSFRHSTCPSQSVGMFLCGHRNTAFDYIHLDVQHTSKPRFNELNFPGDPYTFWIQQACKGLLLCCSSGSSDLLSRYCRSPIRVCYIYNPTLNLFVKLPRPGVTNGVPRLVLGVTLACDPTKPPYKVVCVRGSEFAPDLCQIEIYSTESSEWSLAGKPFRAAVNFKNAVYWNGSVYWVYIEESKVLFFNADEEKLGEMSLPNVPDGHQVRGIDFLGESYDKLHLVISYDMEVKLIVYEMQRGQPDWSVKHQIDLKLLAAAFPGLITVNLFIRAVFYDYAILLLIRGDDETANLVIEIQKKIVLFNLEHKTFEEIHEFEGTGTLFKHSTRAFEYIQSLSMFSSPASCQ